MADLDMCCGGTRPRIGCTYHDPALQPAAAPQVAEYDAADVQVFFGGVPLTPANPSFRVASDDTTKALIQAAIAECIAQGVLDPTDAGEVVAARNLDGSISIVLPGVVRDVVVRGTVTL